MSIPDQLRNIRDHLRSGCFGQREVWERQLEEAAVEVERLPRLLELIEIMRAEKEQLQDSRLLGLVELLKKDNERLRNTLQLHAGDCQSLDNEINELRAENARLVTILETIAGTARDKLQAMQARSGLTKS
jgi:hypothetical protein